MPRLALLLALALVACDTGADPLVFSGVEVEARGDAQLAVEGGALVASGLDGTRSGGFRVAGTPDRVDVALDPVAIPDGGRFGIEVEGTGDEPLAAIYNEGTGGGRFEVRASFADVLGVETVTVRYRRAGRVVFVIEALDLAPVAGRRRGRASAGSSDDDPESAHVIRENGRYIVVSDKEGSADGGRRGCSGFLLRLPAPFDVDLPDGLCTDWIEVEPNGGAAIPVGRVAVTARGVGSFRVTGLSAD